MSLVVTHGPLVYPCEVVGNMHPASAYYNAYYAFAYDFTGLLYSAKIGCSI